MSFHTGQTFTYGEQPSASKWQWVWDNDYALADGSTETITGLLTSAYGDTSITSEKLKSTVMFRGTSTMSIANAAQTDITTWTEVTDRGTDFNHTTGIFTAPYDGDYLFLATSAYDNIPANGRVVTWLLQGASTVLAETRTISGGATQDPSATCGVIVALAATATVKVATLHDTGSSANLRFAQFSGALLGRF